MNKTVKAVLLAVVILACLGFVVLRLTRSSGGGGGGAATASAEDERDMYCLECKAHYTAVLKKEDYGRLFMAGTNAVTKHTCTTCGKATGVVAVKCAACGEWVPSPGTQGMNRPGGGAGAGMRAPAAPACPKCKKPLEMPRLGEPQAEAK